MLLKIPRAPAHFSAEARKFWRRVHCEYVMTPDSTLLLRVACEQWDRAQQARAEVTHKGLTVDGRRNPASDIERQAYGLFLRTMRQLGLDVEPSLAGPGRPPKKF